MEKPQSLSSDLRVIGKLGEGSFAEVFKVKSMRTQQVFAVKRLKKRFRSIEEVNHLPEIMALQALQGYPSIIKLFDVMFDSNSGYVAMVFELMDANLYEFMRDNKKALDEKLSLLLVYQLLTAIALMHTRKLFHRDVKPENCMINKKTYELKLVDFGSTRSVTDTNPYTEYVSTRWYRAPECILTSGSYGNEVDEWAVGCMLYELLTSRPLFPGKHEIDQIARIHNILGTPSRDVLAQFKQNPNTQINFVFPPRSAQDLQMLIPSASKSTVELLKRLLTYDPQDRISAKEALEHSAFNWVRSAEERFKALQNPQLSFPQYALQMFSPQITKGIPETINENISKPDNIPKHVDHATKNNVQPAFAINDGDKSSQQNTKPEGNSDLPKLKEIQAPPKKEPYIPGNMKSDAGLDLIASRIKAAARIKEYNKKMMLLQGPSQIKKPLIQKYHKPLPELVQPRLPHLGPTFVH